MGTREVPAPGGLGPRSQPVADATRMYGHSTAVLPGRPASALRRHLAARNGLALRTGERPGSRRPLPPGGGGRRAARPHPSSQPPLWAWVAAPAVGTGRPHACQKDSKAPHPSSQAPRGRGSPSRRRSRQQDRAGLNWSLSPGLQAPEPAIGIGRPHVRLAVDQVRTAQRRHPDLARWA